VHATMSVTTGRIIIQYRKDQKSVHTSVKYYPLKKKKVVLLQRKQICKASDYFSVSNQVTYSRPTTVRSLHEIDVFSAKFDSLVLIMHKHYRLIG